MRGVPRRCQGRNPYVVREVFQGSFTGVFSREFPGTSVPTNEVAVNARKRILLVEDNEDNRIIYATALRFAGYEVLEAITGTEGVHQARTNHPDLILMDISVPELDGWEATAILKADPATRHIPIVAVTAHALPGDETRSMEAGCDGYLAKPISPALLIADVDRRFGLTTPSYAPVRFTENVPPV